MKCKVCGYEIPEESMFCLKCGTKVESCVSNNNNKTFPLCGDTISFDNDIIEFNEIRTGFMELAVKSRNDFIGFYKSKIKTFDDLYEIALPKFVECILEAVRFGVFILMDYDIDYIDEQSLIEHMDEDELRVEYTLNMFNEYSEMIQDAVDELSDYRATQRASRSRWEGGGFGLSGAIKGALTAGALNMATNAVRGIGDSLTNSSDRAKINELKNRIVKAEENITILYKTIYSAYNVVFTYVYSILMNESIVSGIDNDTKILDAKINNYMNLYVNKKEGYDKLFNLLIQAIEKWPYNAEYYSNLYRIAKTEKQSILLLADYFDVAEDYVLLIEEYDKERVNQICNAIENTNIRSINMKIDALEQIQNDNPLIDNRTLIEELKRKKRML